MELKPCPFCGSSNIELTIGTKDREGTPVNLACVECGAYGPWMYSNGTFEYEIAADEWNRRAGVTNV